VTQYKIEIIIHLGQPKTLNNKYEGGMEVPLLYFSCKRKTFQFYEIAKK